MGPRLPWINLPVMTIRFYSPATFTPMQRLSWRSILQRVEGRRITGLWYGVEDGYLRLELDDGSTLLVAASREGVHVVVESCWRQTNSRVGVYWANY